MLIKKIHTNRVSSRMRRSVTAKSIPTKFCTSTPWGDVVIYLTWHRNWLRGFGGVGCENGPLPLTLALASNTAYCASAHTRDPDWYQLIRVVPDKGPLNGCVCVCVWVCVRVWSDSDSDRCVLHCLVVCRHLDLPPNSHASTHLQSPPPATRPSNDGF